MPHRALLIFSRSVSNSNRTHHDVVTDYIGRRAVDPELLGELEAFLDARAHLFSAEVAFDARDVEPNVLGGGKRTGLVDLAAPGHELLVIFEVLLAGLVLHAHRNADFCRILRAWPKDGKFLEHDLEIGVSLHQRHHVGHGALAVAAIVVEELDEGDIALRIPDRNVARRVEQDFGIVLDRRLVLFGLALGLALLKFGDCVLQHLRIVEQVLADDAFDFGALRVRNGLSWCNSGSEPQ